MSAKRLLADVNLWGVMWLGAAVVLGLATTWGLPRLVTLVPFTTEQHLGRLIDTTSLGPLCVVDGEPGWEALVDLVGRLYPQSERDEAAPVTLHLVQSSQVNAFAALGGQVYILTGLLAAAQSPDALAGVLAHELEHVSRRHLLQHLADDAAISSIALALIGEDSAASQVAQSADYWSGLHFSRAQEAQADAGGMQRMRRAGIGLDALATFFETLGRGPQMPSWTSDHPGLDSRIAALRAQAPYDAVPALTWSSWQAVRALCRDKP